jgi:DNA end-binding protein Ku
MSAITAALGFYAMQSIKHAGGLVARTFDESRHNGLLGMLLRYPYEVRGAADYFDDIKEVKITKDMLDLAKHIVDQKSGHFEPDHFEVHYEKALSELLAKKQKGLPITTAKRPAADNVVDLMEALRKSLKPGSESKSTKAPAKKTSGKKRKAS